VSLRKCGRCKEPGHTGKTCPRNPESTWRMDVPPDMAEIALRRVRPFIRANGWAPNFLESLMLSCYLQGALDARTPQFDAELARAK